MNTLLEIAACLLLARVIIILLTDCVRAFSAMLESFGIPMSGIFDGIRDGITQFTDKIRDFFDKE